MRKKEFFCPVNAWDCPYWKENRCCSMVDDGEDPVLECDDAGMFFEPDEDHFVWIDEESCIFDTENGD